MSNQNVSRVPDPTLPRIRGSAVGRVLRGIILFVLIFGLAIVAAGALCWSLYTAPGPLKETKIIEFPQGASRSDIANRLEAMGVISDARLFNGAAIINNLARGASLKPGEYQFTAGETMAEAMHAIISGQVMTYKLTIPEGWTSALAAARINDNDVLEGDAVQPAAEGAVLADTFVFRRGMTRAKLLQDMMAGQNKLVDEMWARRPADTPLKSKEEMVTLASIVEKETGKDDERPRVAAVFLNRLRKGMRLQSDPTIIYGITSGKTKLDRALTKADIEAETPYNTYKILGLPPGPIANPGKAALEAVIAPANTEDLYFVADGTGGHSFAATLEEHNVNVKKWRDAQKAGIQLPGGNAAAADPADQPLAPDTVQPELPAVEGGTNAVGAPEEVPVEGEAIPQPTDGAAAGQAGQALPVPANPPPLNQPKAGEAAAPAPAEATPAPATLKSPDAVKKPGAAKKEAGGKKPDVKAKDTAKKPAADKKKPEAGEAAIGEEPAPADATAKKPNAAKEPSKAAGTAKKATDGEAAIGEEPVPAEVAPAKKPADAKKATDAKKVAADKKPAAKKAAGAGEAAIGEEPPAPAAPATATKKPVKKKKLPPGKSSQP